MITTDATAMTRRAKRSSVRRESTGLTSLRLYAAAPASPPRAGPLRWLACRSAVPDLLSPWVIALVAAALAAFLYGRRVLQRCPHCRKLVRRAPPGGARRPP